MTLETDRAAYAELEDRVAALLALLRPVLGADHVFDGEPDAVMDSDGKAHPYAAVWVTPGDDTERRLNGSPDGLLWSFQVTAAGGDQARARRACSRVLAALLGPDRAGRRLLPGTGRIRLATAPGPFRVDREVPPPRTYVPLLFEVYLP